MTVFIIVCAVMLFVAVFAVSFPLLRPVAATVKGEPVVAPAIVPAAAMAGSIPVEFGTTAYGYDQLLSAMPRFLKRVRPTDVLRSIDRLF